MHAELMQYLTVASIEQINHRSIKAVASIPHWRRNDVLKAAKRRKGKLTEQQLNYLQKRTETQIQEIGL